MGRIKKCLCILFAIITAACTMLPFTAYAATESELRSKVVSVAKNEVGYTGSSSYSKYGEWYGYQGGWCTTFALWCFNQAGNSYSTTLYGKITPSGGNCNSMISWYSGKDRYYTRSSGYTPKAGDLVFFDWSGNGSSQHVGIVSSTSGSTIYTIEGNCSGKVKEKVYTKNGSKPYESTSSIMGYGVPDFASVAGGSSKNTTKKSTTKKKQTTTKKHTTTTTKHTTQQYTTKKETTNATTKKQTTTKPTTKLTTTTLPTTKQIVAKKLSISASTYDLKVGDSVKLNYSVVPANAPAVIGYFCDEEGIIEIGAGGNIKAIGTGTATVVVCANDELYSQCDFKVTEAVAAVTTTEGTTRNVVGKVTTQTETTQKSVENTLTNMGVNVTLLKANKTLYIIPATIIAGTAIISVFVAVTKKVKQKKRLDMLITNSHISSDE